MHRPSDEPKQGDEEQIRTKLMPHMKPQTRKQRRIATEDWRDAPPPEQELRQAGHYMPVASYKMSHTNLLLYKSVLRI